jgi:predicted nucleic acid-binding protein
VYFDTSYIAKFYLNEPESERVRGLAKTAHGICSSQWAIAEFHAVLHRQLREGFLSKKDVRSVAAAFEAHVGLKFWVLAPVREGLLREMGASLIAAPSDLYLRAADAVHLATAKEMGEAEVWTNDRHMLKACEYFGLRGRSVTSA